MDKPKEILDLEKLYNLEIRLLSKEINTKNFEYKNYYRVNESGKIISLNLSGNNLTSLEKIGNLIQLKTLDLSNNSLTDISNLDSLINLQDLNLSSNSIQNIDILKQLKHLKIIDLSNNNLDEVISFENQDLLTNLNLSNNRISSIEKLRKNRSLKILDLSKNIISDISPILVHKYLEKVNLHNNPKVEIDFPAEILNSGWSAVKLFSEKSKEKIVFKNVKVLLLGNPNIGKTTLLKYLETNKIVSDENYTHGVEYKNINLNNIDYHFWDFGGQEYFHATHKLFFSKNALNIVIWGQDVQRISENEKCFNVDYWLRLIEQLNGKNNEIVLLTENKIDLNSPKFSEVNILPKLENNFPHVRIYDAHISIKESKNLIGFKEKLNNISEEIISKFEYPKFYEVFWRRIKNIDRDYVSISEINNRLDKSNTISAIRVFHNMGMVLYFSNIIEDKVFVKPQVLLDILYSSILRDKNIYKISDSYIAESIEGNSLNLKKEQIIKLLKHFNLVFEIKEEKDYYFIPQYLNNQNDVQKYYEKLGFNECNIIIKADQFLVSQAMLKIFSFYGTFASKKDCQYLFWKDGIVIDKDNSQVLVKFDIENQFIKIYRSKNNKDLELEKNIVDYILDLPEDHSMPKRNFENHIKKRWHDVLNEDDPDYSPHFSDRLEHYPDYYEEFINRNYHKEYNWKSEYFKVYLSTDGEYFADWNYINSNKNLLNLNFENHKKQVKSVSKEYYYAYVNDKYIKPVENKTNQIFNIDNKGGNIGSVINNGNLSFENNPNKNPDHNKDDKSKQVVENYVKEKLKIWKRNAWLYLLIYLIFYMVGILFYYINPTFNNKPINNLIFFDILKYGYPILGTILVYKLWYERICDPSKEKAKRDLLKDEALKKFLIN